MLKVIILIFIFCSVCLSDDMLPTISNSYYFGNGDNNGSYKTVSTRLELETVVREGDDKCEHRWVSRVDKKRSMISCAVYHPDGHCSWNDPVINRICSLCGRKEVQRERPEIIFVPNPISEYEILDDKWNKED